MAELNPFRSIAIAANPQRVEAFEEAEKVADLLGEFGIKNFCRYLNDPELHQKVAEGAFNLLIALGGDGTMLRAGQLCAPFELPILGINVGRFGFLVEIHRDHWPSMLPRILEGDYWLEKRMMVRAQQYRGGQSLGTWEALNEAVVSHGRIKRPVHLVAHVDDRYLTTYVADGLITATPTGSTAYALAAGGPILPPDLRNILLVPVAPHLTLDRAIVLAEGSAVSITVKTSHEAALAIDGQLPIDLQDGDRVDVRASDHDVYFVRIQDPGYFYRNITSCMNQNPSIRETT